MKNKIYFYPIEERKKEIVNYIDPPSKVSQNIPQWFKDAPRYHNKNKSMFADKKSGYHNLTIRHCIPFLDALTSGYVMTTWTDIHIKKISNKKISILYGDNEIENKYHFNQILYQENFISHVPSKYNNKEFVCAWSTYWRVKTTKGISCLFTHPLNRTDLPFTTLSGITDTDSWHGSDVLNFSLSKDFEGTIPKGTPFVQIIPFVRSDWESIIKTDSDHNHKKIREVVSELRFNLKSGFYRDKLWTNKRYI